MAREDVYYPQTGTETFIASLSSLREFLPTEYDLTFCAYPRIKQLAQDKKWPDYSIRDRSEQSWQGIFNLIALSEKRLGNSEKDVEFELGKFRKTVLGLEK